VPDFARRVRARAESGLRAAAAAGTVQVAMNGQRPRPAAMTAAEQSAFVDALRGVLGLGPLGGETWRPDVDRFAPRRAALPARPTRVSVLAL
jgi:hypothetical protein